MLNLTLNLKHLDSNSSTCNWCTLGQEIKSRSRGNPPRSGKIPNIFYLYKPLKQNIFCHVSSFC